MLRNLVTNVIEKERITTTILRAKAAQPLVEKMITLGKRDTLHARRQAAAFLHDAGRHEEALLGSRSALCRSSGGYTRIIRAGWRIGDGAELAILELIGSKLKKKEKKAKREEAVEEPKEKEAAAK